MSASQIIAQAIGIFVIIIFAAGAQAKSQRSFLLCQILGNSFVALYYLLLSATTGAVICAVAVVRTIIFYVCSRRNKKVSLWLFTTILLVTIGMGILTWDGWLSVAPILATFGYAFANWQSDTQKTRAFLIFGAACWLLYNIFYKGYSGIAEKIIEITSSIVGLVRHRNHSPPSLPPPNISDDFDICLKNNNLHCFANKTINQSIPVQNLPSTEAPICSEHS